MTGKHVFLINFVVKLTLAEEIKKEAIIKLRDICTYLYLLIL
jgi:hypothetical protein